MAETVLLEEPAAEAMTCCFRDIHNQRGAFADHFSMHASSDVRMLLFKQDKTPANFSIIIVVAFGPLSARCTKANASLMTDCVCIPRKS